MVDESSSTSNRNTLPSDLQQQVVQEISRTTTFVNDLLRKVKGLEEWNEGNEKARVVYGRNCKAMAGLGALYAGFAPILQSMNDLSDGQIGSRQGSPARQERLDQNIDLTDSKEPPSSSTDPTPTPTPLEFPKSLKWRVDEMIEESTSSFKMFNTKLNSAPIEYFRYVDQYPREIQEYCKVVVEVGTAFDELADSFLAQLRATKIKYPHDSQHVENAVEKIEGIVLQKQRVLRACKAKKVMHESKDWKEFCDYYYARAVDALSLSDS